MILVARGDMSDDEEMYEVNFFHKKYMQPAEVEANNRSTIDSSAALAPEVIAKDEEQEEMDRQHRKEVTSFQALRF